MAVSYDLRMFVLAFKSVVWASFGVYSHKYKNVNTLFMLRDFNVRIYSIDSFGPPM